MPLPRRGWAVAAMPGPDRSRPAPGLDPDAGAEPGLAAPAGVAVAVSWSAVGSAVALLTSLLAGAGDQQSAVLGDCPPGEALSALLVIAGACIEVLSSGDNGARVLEGLGLLALTRAAEQP